MSESSLCGAICGDIKSDSNNSVSRTILLSKPVFFRGIYVAEGNEIREKNDENVWASLCKNHAKQYAKPIPDIPGSSHLLKIETKYEAVFYKICLKKITCRYYKKYHVNVPIPVWQKNTLLPALMKALKTNNIIGFYDEPTEEYWIESRKYNIISICNITHA